MTVQAGRFRQSLRWTVLFALALALAACSINVSGLTPAGASPPSPTAPLIAPTWTVGPTPSQSAAATAPSNAGQPQPTPFSKPVTWADQHLEGKLIFTAGTEGELQFDLATGMVTSLFTPPDPTNAWVVASAVYSSVRQLVMAYAPPPVGGDVQFGYTELYGLPPDGGPPQPIFSPAEPKASFFDPTWSPDGHWLYYVHLTAPVTQTDTSHFAIERLAYPGGQPTVVVPDAFWPRLSPDGQQLAFVHYDYQNGLQTLFVAKPDGSGQRQIRLPAAFQSCDSPLFTPDDKTIVFSGITDGIVPALSWLDQLLGVHSAYADGSPANWWTVPAAGGDVKQLNVVSDSSMYAAFAPDGQHIAYISVSGLFVMKPDGTDIIQLLSGADMPGSVGSATVDWIE